MSDLTPTQRDIRVIVAQRLPGVPADLCAAYAEHIHPATPFGQLGLADVDFYGVISDVEKVYAIRLCDDDAERAKTVAALARIVDEHLQAEAA